MAINGMKNPSVHTGDTGSKQPSARPTRHPAYWFNDGSLIFQVQDVAYKLHKTLLTRHSPVLSKLTDSVDDGYSISALRLPDELDVTNEDFERLLEHLYHDIALGSEVQLTRIGSILRVSSAQQLHFPDVHDLARARFQSLFSGTLEELSHSESADQALALAIQYKIYPSQKQLFYSVATHTHFEEDETSPEAAQAAGMSSHIFLRCKNLLDQLINHFTPILFTVATAGHMACTDVLAETWMPRVIQPALENNGLCRPIETLQAIIDLDWGTHGLCQDCITEKRLEWKTEQETVWNKLDGWTALPNQE